MAGTIIAVIIAGMNLYAFLLMGIDKKRAQSGGWRIPEKRLFLAAACFGALGGCLGMQVFRHKTKHWYFQVFFPVLLVLQLLVIGLVVYGMLK